MKKKLYFILMAAMVLSFSACGGDDGSGNKGGAGGGGNSGGNGADISQWYVPRGFNVTEEVNSLSKQVNNSIKWGYTKASDFFKSDGEFDSPSSHYDENGNQIIYPDDTPYQDYVSAIHIIDKNTLEVCYGEVIYKLGASAVSNRPLYYSVDLGKIVGKVGVYACYSVSYTYDKIENKIYVPKWGEIFTVTNDGLLQDGGGTYIPFTPEKNYQGSVNDSGNNRAFLSCPNNNHPHPIDLGLPSGTLWACCDVGASSPTQEGDRYAWGETEVKSQYTWENYLYGNSKDNVVDIGSDIAGTKYDVAYVKWGSSWQMPTQEQFVELSKHITLSWNEDVAKLEATNGGSIYFVSFLLWSSTVYLDGHAWVYDVPRNGIDIAFPRCGGWSVRPVRKN